MKLDRATLNTLTLPPGKSEKKYFDERLPGHGVRLRHPSDQSKWRWITQYDINGNTQTVTQGKVTLLDPGAAFKRSRDLLASVRLGGDPAAEKREARARARETFGALLPRYLGFKRGDLAPRSYVETERHLCAHAKPLHHLPVTDIDRRAIAALITAIATKRGPTAANCTRSDLSGYFTWLAREGLLDANPVSFTNKALERAERERVLAGTELPEVWQALAGMGEYGDLSRLLLLTLARRAEIGGLIWDEVDLDVGEIRLPATRTKAGRPHVIPLVSTAAAILAARRSNGRGFVFGRGLAGYSNWSWAKTALDARIAAARKAAGITVPMPEWTLHDFRRTGSTVMHEQLGVPPHVVEAVLGHVGHQHGIAGTYNRATYAVEKRRALEKWTSYIETLVYGKQPAVIVVDKAAGQDDGLQHPGAA